MFGFEEIERKAAKNQPFDSEDIQELYCYMALQRLYLAYHEGLLSLDQAREEKRQVFTAYTRTRAPHSQEERQIFEDCYRFFDRHKDIKMEDADWWALVEDMGGLTGKYNSGLCDSIMAAVVLHLERKCKGEGKKI